MKEPAFHPRLWAPLIGRGYLAITVSSVSSPVPTLARRSTESVHEGMNLGPRLLWGPACYCDFFQLHCFLGWSLSPPKSSLPCKQAWAHLYRTPLPREGNDSFPMGGGRPETQNSGRVIQAIRSNLMNQERGQRKKEGYFGSRAL